MPAYFCFLKDVVFHLFKGNKIYFIWLFFLGISIVTGILHYLKQLDVGLSYTDLTNQVTWGVYIANFTFLVGIAAAAVLLVVPAYIFKKEEIKKIVILGELLAMSAIIMCLLFVIVDLGRPDRIGHIVPFLGNLNLPYSILAWDVVVLNGYLILNLHIPGYLLYKKYINNPPKKYYYLPFVYISIFWAVFIHTVTAFLYSGFGSRPFWNSAVLAPRFLVSAFASGPALLFIVFLLVSKFTSYKISSKVFSYLRNVMAVALPINLFLYFCEVFKELYTGMTHSISMEYLFVGINGHYTLTPYIWGSLLFSIIGLFIVYNKNLYTNRYYMTLASLLIFLGIWVEKGMGLIIPGFIPTPLGDLVEYSPSSGEFFISFGIWAIGALVLTLSYKVFIAIETKVISK